ncbi:MAG: hypothetical protein ACKO40_09480 [Planctomycetaceae bacterium]
MLHIMQPGETVEQCLARLRRLPSTPGFPGSGPEWDALVEQVQAEAAARVGDASTRQDAPKLVRFDFPAGMSAEAIAAALREAYDRIVAAKAADEETTSEPDPG